VLFVDEDFYEQYSGNILESTAVILLPICFLNGAWKTESSHQVFAVV